MKSRCNTSTAFRKYVVEQPYLPADGLAPLFPHIYGPIDRAAVVEVRPVRRSADGEFLGW